MTVPKSLTRTQTHVRCGSSDCDWGTPVSSFREGELGRCRDEFRQHCIKRHGLDPNDGERLCWVDLEALTLLADRCARVGPDNSRSIRAAVVRPVRGCP
jgi:hypothetical protein